MKPRRDGCRGSGWAFLLLVILAAPASSAAGQMREVLPVDGDPFPANLAAVGDDWSLTFNAVGSQRRLAGADLVRWGTCPEVGTGPLIVLADGGVLAADVLWADRKQVVADSRVFGLVSLPLETVAGVVFRPPSDGYRRDRLLARIASAEERCDGLLLANGDQLTGVVEAIRDRDAPAAIELMLLATSAAVPPGLGLQNQAAWAAERFDTDRVRLATEGGFVEVDTGRIVAVVFNPILLRRPSLPGLRAWVGFDDGSRLLAERLTLDASSLELTAAGQTWRTSAGRIVWLQPLGGRAVYLSDLRVADSQHLPYLRLGWRHQTDANVLGGRLRAGGRQFHKGLGVHSMYRLTYALSEPYRRFEAEVAIDDRTGRRGSVRFRVFVDGRQAYASPVVRGGDPPLPVRVDLDGAKRLDLVVDFADRADQQDDADWLDARLAL